MLHDALRTAVETGDLEAILATMSPDIVFHSPVTFKPFEGRDAVAMLFGILLKTFEDFRYIGEFTAEDGSAVLRFLTRVGDRDVEGIDLVHYNDDGLIDDFTVFVRPLSAVHALRDSIGAQLAAQG